MVRGNRKQLYFSLPTLSILIRVSSAKPSGVSECMEAISTLRGRSQMPLISSRRPIGGDCEPTGLHVPSQDSRRGAHAWGHVNGEGLS